MITRTYLAKALAATEGMSTNTVRGLLDQAAKHIVVDKQVLARIIGACVSEAAPFSVSQLEQLLPDEAATLSIHPVNRVDAAAARGRTKRKMELPAKEQCTSISCSLFRSPACLNY